MGKTSLCFSNKHLVSVTKHTYYSFTHAKPTACLEAGSPGHLGLNKLICYLKGTKVNSNNNDDDNNNRAHTYIAINIHCSLFSVCYMHELN